MPNAGYPSVVHGRNVYLSSPDYLREYAGAFVEAGAAIVGGCCGTTPEHIRAMAREVSGRKRAHASRPVSIVVEAEVEHLVEPPIETSRLKRKLAAGDDFVVTAEVEPPRGAECSSAIEGARLLKASGVDAVNVTDNPMARLRMSSIAVAALIQREVGLDAVVQITTRDRNVLGLQSDLLGAAGLGVKAILCLGGDPLKIGDYPQAKQVSEVDVLGLLRIAKGLNAGADLAGNAIGTPTRFAIACAANPAAADLEVELSKLRAKIEAGASFAQTQPVYDLDALAGFLQLPEARAIPILVGLIPLLSLKQTLFFANEVPGVVVPPAIQDRMRRAAEKGGDHERAEGLAIARELAAGIAKLAPGLHIMPMGKYKTAGEILAAIPRRETSRHRLSPGIARRPQPFSHLRRPSHTIRTHGCRRRDVADPRRKTMKRTILAAAVLTGLLTNAWLQAGAQARLSGTVLDASGQPVEGATITLTTPSLTNFKQTFKSDKNGKYGTIINDATLTYHIKVQKDGFAVLGNRREDRDRRQLPAPDQAPAGHREPPPQPPSRRRRRRRGVQQRPGGHGVQQRGRCAQRRRQGGGGDEFPGGHEKESRPSQRLAGPDAAFLRQEGLGEDAGVRPQGHRSRPVGRVDLPHDGRGRQAIRRRRSCGGVVREEPPRPIPRATRRRLYNAGVAAYNKGKMKEAEASLTKAVEANPDFAEAHYLLGMAAFNQNKKAVAKEHLEKYLELAPTGKEAGTVKEILPLLK